MTDAVQEASPLQVTKLVTIMEEADQEVRAEIIRQHFEDYDDATMKNIITNLLTTAAERIRLEVTRLGEANDESSTPVNPGSLYDELVFETSVYASNDGQVLVNTSFGRLANPDLPLVTSVEHVAEVISFIAQQFRGAELAPSNS